MTEVLTLAKERIKAIDFEIATLANEQQELETFIRVYDSLAAPEKAQPVAPAGEGAHNPTSPAPNPVAKPAVEAVDGCAMSEGEAVDSSPKTAEAGSRLDAGRTASATSEDMDVTSPGGEQPGTQPPGSASPTLRQLVAPIMRAHPDWSGAKIAAEIDRPKASVAATMSMLRNEARLKAETTSASPAETLPRSVPRGTQFYLRNDAGDYLHFSCTTMTKQKGWAWKGSEQQLGACRRRFEIARDLHEQPVEKEQARVAA